MLTSPFVPMLFAGEEWAASTPFQYFTSFPDADLGRAVRDGRRREFAEHGFRPERVPDPQARDTYEQSKLRWSELEQPAHASMLDWYRRLIALRQSEPDLQSGRLDDVHVELDASAGWMSVRRGSVLVAFNVGGAPVRVAAGEVLLASAEVARVGGALELPPDSVVIARPAFAGAT